MAISGIVVVPVHGKEEELSKRLNALPGVSVEGLGPAGIAATMEADTSEDLNLLSEQIEKWEEVLNFQLAYLNCE
jgi:nitrate reductase NapAB chaperone NapD